MTEMIDAAFCYERELIVCSLLQNLREKEAVAINLQFTYCVFTRKRWFAVIIF